MKQMRVGLSLVLVGILILTLVLTACIGSQAAPKPDQIVLYKTTKVFTEKEAENIAEVTENRTKILFEKTTPFVAGIELGDVLVCNQSVPGAEYGFLKRVIEVSDDGKAVEVEPATLEDAIERGEIVVNQTIPVEDLMADAMWAPGVQVLQVGAGRHFTIQAGSLTVEGDLKVTADARVDLKASFWKGLEKFEFVFSPGFEMGASLTSETGVTWGTEVPLGEVSWPIPIWGPVTLNLGIGLVVGTEGEIKAEVKASVTYTRGYDVGFRYDKYAGWSKISEITGEGTHLGEPSFKGEARARVYGGVVLSASVGVRYVVEAGINLELLGNVEGSGVMESLPWKWEYDFECYLSAQLAVGLDALLIGDVEHKFDPWRWPEPPYILAYGASGRVITKSGEALPGVTIAFSGGRGPAATGPGGYWTKHLLSGAVTAMPQKDGYTFEPPTITMTGAGSNYDFVATEQVKYQLTTSSTQGGFVAKPAENPSKHYEGTSVKLVAKPHGNGKFVRWTGDIANIAEPDKADTSITMDGDYSVTANFELLEHYCGDCIIQKPNDEGINETCDQDPNIVGGSVLRGSSVAIVNVRN